MAFFTLEIECFTFDPTPDRSEEHTSELQSQSNLVCRLLLEKKKTTMNNPAHSDASRQPELYVAPYMHDEWAVTGRSTLTLASTSPPPPPPPHPLHPLPSID